MKNETKEKETERRGTSALTRLLAPRETKYRAWLPDKKIMRPVTKIHFGDEGEALTIIFEVTSESKFHTQFVHGENGYLLEFTGLEDKNDKDIYEGDIVESEMYGTGIVQWNNDKSEYQIYVPSNPDDDQYYFVSNFGKVIGNIFETPQLIQ